MKLIASLNGMLVNNRKGLSMYTFHLMHCQFV